MLSKKERRMIKKATNRQKREERKSSVRIPNCGLEQPCLKKITNNLKYLEDIKNGGSKGKTRDENKQK